MRARLIIVLAVLCLLGAASAADEKPAASGIPAAQPALPSKVAVIPISGDIDYGLQKSLERRLDAALEQGAGVVVFEYDPSGGELDPGAEMADMIVAAGQQGEDRGLTSRRRRSPPARSSAWPASRSSCTTSTTLGDCEAIMVSPQSQTMEPAPEKVQTFVRVLMRKYSKSNGYPEALCEKMVDLDMEVYR